MSEIRSISSPNESEAIAPTSITGIVFALLLGIANFEQLTKGYAMSTDNLIQDEAIEKLSEMAQEIDFCMLATNLREQPFHTVPMSTKHVDSAGRIWFLSGADSDHNAHISTDRRAQLVYSHPDDFKFLTVYGAATIVTDREILSDLYSSRDDAWYDGVDDPNLSAICIEPSEAHYWDRKQNKLATMFKLGVAEASGERPDLMNQGSLTV